MSDGLDRSARASRGKRMSKSLCEEAEADDEFWNQDAFKEDAEDKEYATEDEEADYFDSDFDDDEPSEDEEAVEEDRRPVKKKKRKRISLVLSKDKKKSAFKDKKQSETKKLKAAPKVATKLAHASGGVNGDSDQTISSPPESGHVGNHQEIGGTTLEVDGERSLRKSTRTAVIIKQAEREAHQAALQALSKPLKKKKEEERKISQEEMLLEAAQTEIQNLQALEVMLAREEEVKHIAINQKAIYTGPQIRFHSRNGINILEFTKADEFPSALNSNAVQYPRRIVCVVTGLPAKYRDPRSGLPYATKEAFKIIRDRFDQKDNPRRTDPILELHHQRKRTKVERERTGSGGRTIVTKLKYRKVNNDAITNKDASPAINLSTPIFPKALEVDAKVQNIENSVRSPAQIGSAALGQEQVQSVTDSSQLATFLAEDDFSSLNMPEDFVEANEADFMLDDLESLPSNLGSGISLQTAMEVPPVLLDHDPGNNHVPSDAFAAERLDASVPIEQNQNLLTTPPIIQILDLGTVRSGERLL